MAVGLLNRAASQPEFSTGTLKVTKRRRNGMAYIFHGQSSDDIFYLKECFSQRFESTSSGSDFESDSDSDIELDSLFEGLRDHCYDGQRMDVDTDTENSDMISMESESTDSGYQVTPAARRLALADIFEGVPEAEVGEFLAKFSTIDTDDNESTYSEYESTPTARRMALADIFEGVTEDEKIEFFAKMSSIDTGDNESTLSEHEFTPTGRRLALADIFEGVPEDKLTEFLSKISSIDTYDNESTYSEYGVIPATRRLALADIFEGVHEDEVSEFLARFSSIDTDNDDAICSGDDQHQHITRTRRFAKSNIFDGIPKEQLDEMLQKYNIIDNDIDSCEAHQPNTNYINRRRGALADIFHDIDDDLKSTLAKYSAEDTCSSSDGSDSQTESDDSGVQMNGHGSDSSLPDESYLWRRRAALANIFDFNETGTTENRFRDQ